MERILLVSADSHITMPPEAAVEHLEDSYQHLLEDYLHGRAIALETFVFAHFTPEALE
jgi:hypothetical protein